MKIDIALICGRRPELLEQTLSSFHERVFKNFDVAQCYANIDPFCGDAQDAVRCRSIILDYFPGAEITIPNEASFGRAVQTTWARVQSPVVLHLEDDWVVLEEIFPHHVFPVLSGSTMALQLMHKGLKWNGRDLFREVVRKRKIWGITVSRVRASVFGTAPAFFSGPFLRQCAALMRSDLDPEKQMRPPHNMPLITYTDQFRCRLLHGQQHRDVIGDIGRSWRETRGIVKVVSGGRSVWSEAPGAQQLPTPSEQPAASQLAAFEADRASPAETITQPA